MLASSDNVVSDSPCVQEKYKRALADTENLRTRSQRMIDDAKIYGKDTLQFGSDSLSHFEISEVAGYIFKHEFWHWWQKLVLQPL